MKKEIDVINTDNQVTNKELTNVVKCHVNNLHGFKGWIDLLEDENLRLQIIDDGSKMAQEFLLSLE